jgi:hypothetical protein
MFHMDNRFNRRHSPQSKNRKMIVLSAGGYCHKFACKCINVKEVVSHAIVEPLKATRR